MARTHDLSSGIDRELERALIEPPIESSAYGENHAFWIHDELSGLQINGHLNTTDDLGDFSLRLGKLSVAFPDGRILQSREAGPGTTASTPASATMRFRCIEPFRRWNCDYAGVMQDVTIGRSYLTGAPLDPPRIPVRFSIDTQMVAPAWMQGALTPEGLGPVKAFIGGERYEQLFKHTGTLEVDGVTVAVSGFGNRTHRYGTRNLAAGPGAMRMLGHVWSAAVFPSGAAFGLQIFPTVDGGILWGEAFTVVDGALARAEIVDAPWLRHYRPNGEGFAIRLRRFDGDVVEIEGETLLSVPGMMIPAATAGEQIPIFQSAVRYRLGDETAVNMLERSLRRSSIETGVGRPL
ncbi:hypothetical protein [Sphingomonas immobilis]|uniref:Uncharacterized protein n=1 Tax=Sphingomonas immobilis TaxID=3063997 RepID=A0ABT9A1B0_9SPHN|nr:hypothetical protein [Sphingomonas sp. CA1-15]MDO7843614.1 hypothetical protein [Sphingomonas sp. CA1-15]